MDILQDELDPKKIVVWDKQPQEVRDFWHIQLETINLPPIVFEVLEMDADDDSFDWESLATTVGSDPLLAAKVLAVANSAMMGQVNQITSIERAIIRLGMVLIQAIIVTYHMEGVLLKHPEFKREHFEFVRRWSALSSYITHRLAILTDHPDPATISTAALLSRLSSLVLATIQPAPDEEYWGLPSEVSRLLYEQNRWGMSCPILSAHLTRLWGIPEPLPGLIETCWEPLFEGFEPKNNKLDKAKVIIATGTVLSAAYIATKRSKAREILGRIAYEPLKEALRSLDIVELVIDMYNSRRMQRELKLRAE